MKKKEKLVAVFDPQVLTPPSLFCREENRRIWRALPLDTFEDFSAKETEALDPKSEPMDKHW